MELNLTNKTAIVTGAGGGIGSATAEMMAREGMNVVLLGGHNLEKLQKTEALVKGHGAACLVLPGDLTDSGRYQEWIDAVVDRFGGIDVLVNNAGMAISSPFEEITEEIFDKIFKINVRTPYFLTQAALPYIKKSDCGTIINLASVVAHAGYPLQSPYAASKHAILGFTKSLAREVYDDGVRVHAICPGGVFTDMVRVARPDLTGEGMIMPEEIADIIQFLLKHHGNAVIDEIKVHRVNKEPFLI